MRENIQTPEIFFGALDLDVHSNNGALFPLSLAYFEGRSTQMMQAVIIFIQRFGKGHFD